jgi:hypothetical protein
MADGIDSTEPRIARRGIKSVARGPIATDGIDSTEIRIARAQNPSGDPGSRGLACSWRAGGGPDRHKKIPAQGGDSLEEQGQDRAGRPYCQ